MFRAPCAHRQEVKIVLYSLWYHHTYRWPSRAQVERGLPSVPLITGALGTIKKGFDQNLQLLPGHLSATKLQKITLMSTAHRMR